MNSRDPEIEEVPSNPRLEESETPENGMPGKGASHPATEMFRVFENSSRIGWSASPGPASWSLTRAQQAAIGGAVASLALGLWAAATSWLSGWSLINALAGLVLGLWGLQSPRKALAAIGIACSLLALVIILLR